MNPQRISFARTLPILALLLSYVIIAVPATMAYINFSRASRHESDLRSSVEGAAALTSHAIAAINLSGLVVEYAVGKSVQAWPRGSSPVGVTVPAWRAITYPIYCAPFWWLVGLGLDALFRQRRLGWLTLLSGLLLWGYYLLAIVGMGTKAKLHMLENGHDIIAMACGVGLWFILLSAFPITWLKQWLAHRRLKAKLHARLSAVLQ